MLPAFGTIVAKPEPIADAARAVHRDLGKEADRFGDPFRTDRADSFFHWLAGDLAAARVV